MIGLLNCPITTWQANYWKIVIFNYSHRALTETEKMVLARGLRFCLPPKSVNSISVKCSFEMLYRDLIGLGHSLTSEDQDRLNVNSKMLLTDTFTLMIIQSKSEF